MRRHPLVRRIRLAATTNVAYKVLSVLIALALWFIVRDERVEATLTMALEVEAPAELVVSNEQLPELNVSVTGTRAALARLRTASLTHVVRPRASEPGPVTVRIRPEDLDLPPGVTARQVTPATAPIRLEARAVRRVPVKARILVAEGTGFRVRKVTVTPDRVKVVGPTSVVAGLEEVWTEPIEVAPKGLEPVTAPYAISLPHRQLALETRGPVTVKIEFEASPPASEPSPTPAGLKVNGRPIRRGGLASR